MSCTDDIRRAVKVRRAASPRGRFKLQLGASAQRALISCLHIEDLAKSGQLPLMFDGMAIEKVEDFNGWEVVELR